MTGMKENQSTKGTLRRRRTNKQVQADILSAVGRILQEKDFTHITLMDIAREAKTDPNVVLRQFGSLEQVFDCYIRTIDYWMHDLFGNKALKRGERSALERMFARMTDFLYNSPEMQRLLVWEITDVNDTTCRAAANRETYYREAYEAYERQFARGGEKTPFRQIASLLIAGTYYLVLHRHTSTFGDMDYDTPDGSAVRDYIDVVDLARAHVVAVDRMVGGKSRSNYEFFNVGTGRGRSVIELVETFEKVTGVEVPHKIVGRRAGDIEKIWADTTFANRELGWKATRPIEETLASAWAWEKHLRGMK